MPINNEKEVLKIDTGSGGVKTVRMDFPSNAHSKQEKKVVKKVITSDVVTRKKSTGKKFLETFIGNDMHSVSSYILYDVLIPAARNTISDVVKNGIDMILFGEKTGSRTTRDRGTSRVRYDNPSYNRDDRREMSYKNRSRHNFDDIIIASRGEAEEVLSNLVDLVIDYGQATVSDLYDLVGISEEYTDRKYGWTELRSASVSRVRNGYLLNLPRPILLD